VLSCAKHINPPVSGKYYFQVTSAMELWR